MPVKCWHSSSPNVKWLSVIFTVVYVVVSFWRRDEYGPNLGGTDVVVATAEDGRPSLVWMFSTSEVPFVSFTMLWKGLVSQETHINSMPIFPRVPSVIKRLHKSVRVACDCNREKGRLAVSLY